MRKWHKIALAIHRVLGTALSLLFAAWFLSGLVMIYHTFPKVSEADRLARQESLVADSLPAWEEIQKRLPEGEQVKSVRLTRDWGQTLFHIRTDQGEHTLTADGSVRQPVDSVRLQRIAERWNPSPIVRVDTLRKLEQWIPFASYRRHFPIYKYYYDDEAGHQLYLSSKTGEALQYTSRDSRFWALLGAVPHWVYFTALRQDVDRWKAVVIVLSAAGSLLCVAGIYLGIRDVRLARRRQRLTPYKRFWYKWHHILGTVFGLFVLTFCFSGMMSLVDVEDLGICSRLDFSPIQRLENMRPTEYTLDYREVIKNSPRKIRQMTWEHIGPIPFYHLRTDKGQVRIDARYNDPTRALNLTPVDLRPIMAAVHGDTATIRLTQLTAYDHYYLARSGHLSLPVWLATVDDANHSRYYINPSTGRCRYFGRTERWQHWLYPALHSLRLQPLIAHPWAWNLVMWGLMLGGTLVSLTGLRLAINYLRRKFKR